MSGEMIGIFEVFLSEIEYVKKIKYGDDEYEFVEKKKYDYSDWSCRIDYIIKRARDGKYFVSSYEEGLTDYQEGMDRWFDTDADGRVIFRECKPFEKVVIDYEIV